MKHAAAFRQETVRRITCIAVAFVLCIGILCTAVSISAAVILDKNHAVKAARQTDYIALAAESLKTELSDLAIPSGLPSDFFDDKIYTAELEEMFYACLESNFSGGTYTPDADGLKQKILNDLTAYADSKVESVSGDPPSALEEFSELCTERYLKYINPSSVKYIASVLASVKRFAFFGAAGAALLSAAAFWLLFRIAQNGDLLKYTFSSFMGAGLICGLIPGILLAADTIDRIAILSPSLHDFICRYVNNALAVLVVFAALLLAVSLICLAIDIKRRKKAESIHLN